MSQNTNFVFGKKQGIGLEPLGFIYGPSFAEDSEVGRRALADTRLCAAAPDLLEALVGCIEHMEHSTAQGRAAYVAAITARARATGSPQ
ncbi:hypothetical protein [Hydrogenophaga sp.]|uniref:hypothetical protein n=1 Tax=Hydrogenophaga sp. TaxID=1904254 RepID=UPI003F708915